MKGLIKDRIAFASRAALYECGDVQNFLQESENRRAWIEWCKKEEERKLVGDIPYEKPTPFSLINFIKGITP